MSCRRTTLRWVAFNVASLASTLNFLDRQLLASVAPALMTEFHLSNTQYGVVVSAYHTTYAVFAPFAGAFVDRVGLSLGLSLAVIFWSLSGAATGLTHTLRGLILCRLGLGAGEAAGVPGVLKAGATYLDSAEMGLASGLSTMFIYLGSMAAPLVAAVMAPRFGWRSVFLMCGALGLAWVPFWLFTVRRIPPRIEVKATAGAPVRSLLSGCNLWTVALAYALTLTFYGLWSNWTTVFLVQEHGLTQAEANQSLAWVPPVFAVAGAFLGGLLSFYWIRRGRDPVAARMRVCWFSVPWLLAGAAIPAMPSAVSATAIIGISAAAFQSILSNITLMPIDLFGVNRAAFTNSILISAGAAMQALTSPLIGMAVDRFGFAWVCAGAPLLPLAGVWLLHSRLVRNAVSSDGGHAAGR